MLAGIFVLAIDLGEGGAQDVQTFVLLEDDYEAAEVGSTLEASNFAWSGNDGSNVQAVIVDGEPGEPPHPKSTRWAKLDRAQGGRTEGHLGVEDLALIGGQLHFRFKMCVVRHDANKFDKSAVVEIGVGSTLSGRANIAAGRGGNHRVASNDGDELNADHGVTFQDNVWQDWQIWIDIDRATFEYSVGDHKSGTLRLRDNQPGKKAIKLIEIEPGTAGGRGKDSIVYLDDVRVEYQVTTDRIPLLEKQRQEVAATRRRMTKWREQAATLLEAGSRDAYFLHGEPLDNGHRQQLFLDRSSYADRWDVYRRINEPAKHPRNPVVMPDQPWEHAIGLPNVLYDEQQRLFRMWYANYDVGAWGGAKTVKNYKRTPYMISYAESKDGVAWTKPLLDKVPYMGFEKTNIIFTGQSKAQEFVVLHTPEHLREHGRFMLWYRDSIKGYANCVNVAYSDNGIDWTAHNRNPVYPRALDAQHCPVWDQRRELWLLYARPQVLAANERRYRGENVRARISLTVSRDMKTWTPARHVLAPDELDRGKQPANKGYFFDRMSVLQYGNQYLGFLAIQPRHAADKGWIEMATSSDGLRWQRSPLREPFIPPGNAGDWDAGHTWCLTNVVPVGHWLYLYYVGSSKPWRTRYPANTRAIGLARIRRDRFVGQYAGVDGGWLLSREVKVTGNRLVINISPEHRAWNQTHHGYVQVELLDRSHGVYGKEHIAGFGQDDCAQLRADEYGQVVSWSGKSDLSSLRGKSVYIRFWLKSAYLFGFRFTDTPAAEDPEAK